MARFARRAAARKACAAACAAALAASALLVRAQERIQLDPFAQATHGDARCPEQPPPLLTPQEARVEAHVRTERGLRCAMDGQCEPGGSYRSDPEINERVRALIADDRRFTATSIWVTTSRHWVTLQGCVRRDALRKAVIARVAKAPGVERVFDELNVGPSKAR